MDEDSDTEFALSEDEEDYLDLLLNDQLQEENDCEDEFDPTAVNNSQGYINTLHNITEYIEYRFLLVSSTFQIINKVISESRHVMWNICWHQ